MIFRADELQPLSGFDCLAIRRAIVSELRRLKDRSESFLCDSLSLTVYQRDGRDWIAEGVLDHDEYSPFKIICDHDAVQDCLSLKNRAVDALVLHFTGD